MFTADSEPVYLDKEGYRERLKPSRRRELTSEPVGFSIAPLMTARKDPIWETVLKSDDEMHAQVVRLGAGMNVSGPEPKALGFDYVVVANSSVLHDGLDLPLWSMIVVEAASPATIQAGEQGAEVMMLEFRREDLQ